MSRKRKEATDLWLGLGILLVTVAYHLSGGLAGVLDQSTANLVSNGIFVWLIGMMWIAYQRWRSTSRNESVLDDVISSTGLEVIMVVNQDGLITMCNEAVDLVYGYPVDEVVGRPTEMLFGDRRKSTEYESEIADSLAEYGFHKGEALGQKKNGEDMILEITTAPRKKSDGLVLMVQDITERREHETRLREAKEAAEKANAEKEVALTKLEASYQRLRELEIHRDNLIHMVCHDMKAPLQVLILQLDILKEMIIEKLDNDELDAVDALLAYSRQLEVMVHSMLDLSKLEDGSLPIRLKEGNIVGTVNEALDFARNLGRETDLVLKEPGDLRPMLYDKDIFHRVLVNLLINAVKYSPPGGTIGVELQEKGQFIQILVSDQGPGIPAEYHEKIFEKFGQVRKDGHSRTGSTGLGLTFCRMAVESHGGSIGVISEEGNGSAFWFTLPLEATLIPKRAVAKPTHSNTALSR